MVGSLIKNLGGIIVLCGGYIVGKCEWVEVVVVRLSVFGIGMELGLIFGDVMCLLF